MDPTFDNLPYQIPGPAGGTSFITQSQTPSQASKSETGRRFYQSPWQGVLRQLQTPPHGEVHLTSSIALLRAQALEQKFTRLPKLPVLISSLLWVGRDASVTLLDPSGSIRATIHAQVFDQFRKGIEPGAALLLDDVAAVAYVEKRPAGFRMDADEGLHVSVQACHVKAVFPVACERINIDLSRFRPKESYEAKALNPPIVRRPPSRSVQQARTPLRPRTEVQNILGRRPSSGNGYMNGFRERPYQQRKPPGGYYRQPQGGRGMPSMQQNKRPYTQPPVRQPGMQPIPGRQYGVQPPQKRPAVSLHQSSRPMQGIPPAQSFQRQSPAAEQNGGLSSLTDDQLDELLGDFDMDAAIAASGKSQAVSQAPSRETETRDAKTGTPDSNESDITRSGIETSQSAPVISTKQKGSESGEKVGESDGENASDKQPKAVSSGNRAEQRPLSEVDDAMIDSLLDGLDDDDFR